jgi:hypothetical protein
MSRRRALFGWDDSAPLERGAWPSRRAKLAVAALAVALLGLELWAIQRPHEDWPFTSAPMFAYYHDADWPLFELNLYAELNGGSERPIEPRADLGIGEIAFKRLLFADYYGSIDPRHPAGHHEKDSPELFHRRLSEFCRRVARAFAERTGAPARKIRVEVTRVEQQRSARGELEVKGAAERRTVMVFDVAADRALLP